MIIRRAEALFEADCLARQLADLRGVTSAEFNVDGHQLLVKVALDEYVEATWDELIAATDEFAHRVSDVFSVALRVYGMWSL